MAKYAIRYSETYANTYVVEADSYAKAVDKLKEDIILGILPGPECCQDSEYQRDWTIDTTMVEPDVI